MADHQKLLSIKPSFSRLYRATNMSRYITLGEIEDIVKADESEENEGGEDVTRSRSRRTAKRRRTDRSEEDEGGRAGRSKEEKGEGEEDRQ